METVARKSASNIGDSIKFRGQNEKFEKLGFDQISS